MISFLIDERILYSDKLTLNKRKIKMNYIIFLLFSPATVVSY